VRGRIQSSHRVNATEPLPLELRSELWRSLFSRAASNTLATRAQPSGQPTGMMDDGHRSRTRFHVSGFLLENPRSLLESVTPDQVEGDWLQKGLPRSDHPTQAINSKPESNRSTRTDEGLPSGELLKRVGFILSSSEDLGTDVQLPPASARGRLRMPRVACRSVLLEWVFRVVFEIAVSERG